MKILRTLIGLTTTATVAASLLNAGGAVAARIGSNSTGSSIGCLLARSLDPSTDNSTQSLVMQKTLAASRRENYAKKYEPPPNGNPATNDGTGTR
jgi:hypothetical protein